MFRHSSIHQYAAKETIVGQIIGCFFPPEDNTGPCRIVMTDVSAGAQFLWRFWLACRDKCLPHISHSLSIREEGPLQRAFCGAEKQPVLFSNPHCCLHDSKSIHHVGPPLLPFPSPRTHVRRAKIPVPLENDFLLL